MDLIKIQESLSGLPIGPILYYNRIGSTNTQATIWADQGAPDLSLIVANEQTSGKGRNDRKWRTTPGASLAFSLVLRNHESFSDQTNDRPVSIETISRMTALGAIGVSQALKVKYHLDPKIKWPNDVLLNGRKVAGILAESHWQGDAPSAVILGIGVNITPESVPHEKELVFPATCVQEALGRPISRLELMRSILEHILEWRNQLGLSEFLKIWEEQLAFRGEWVTVLIESGSNKQEMLEGLVLGLDNLGGLNLRDRTGQIFTARTGEIRLLPVEH